MRHDPQAVAAGSLGIGVAGFQLRHVPPDFFDTMRRIHRAIIPHRCVRCDQGALARFAAAQGVGRPGVGGRACVACRGRLAFRGVGLAPTGAMVETGAGGCHPLATKVGVP